MNRELLFLKFEEKTGFDIHSSPCALPIPPSLPRSVFNTMYVNIYPPTARDRTLLTILNPCSVSELEHANALIITLTVTKNF